MAALPYISAKTNVESNGNKITHPTVRWTATEVVIGTVDNACASLKNPTRYRAFDYMGNIASVDSFCQRKSMSEGEMPAPARPRFLLPENDSERGFDLSHLETTNCLSENRFAEK